MLKIDKDCGLGTLFMNLYSHKTLYKINKAGCDISANKSNYSIVNYIFRTSQIPLISKRLIKINKDVDYINFAGNGGVLTTKSGVTGKFSSISKELKLTSNFMPQNCYYATHDAIRQLKKKDKECDFLILDMGHDLTHAVARAKLDNFSTPVIIDASYSLIMEESLYFEIFKMEILKAYSGEDFDKMRVGYNERKQEQTLYFEN